MSAAQGRALVLLVEPDPVIGLDLADALEGAGYQVTGPIRTAAEAEVWLAHWRPALAVLDPGRGDDPGRRLACTLRARRVPFLLHAEATAAPGLDGVWADAPRLAKPAWHRDVVAVLDGLTAPGSGA